MGIAQVCPFCGTDVSGVRTPPDAAYGLPVVVCPGCGVASVRRLLLARWSGGGVWAGVRAGAQAVFAGLAVLVIGLATLGVVMLNAEALRDSLYVRYMPRDKTRLDLWLDEFGAVGAGMMVFGPVVAAVGMAWVLPHRRAWARVLVCVCVVSAMLWVLPNVGMWMQHEFTNPVRYRPYFSERGMAPRPRLELGHWLWVASLVVFGSLMLAATPVSRLFEGAVSRRRLRGRLARARRRRMKGRS